MQPRPPGDRHDRLELAARVVRALEPHPAVRAVELTGSRAEGRASAFSDWDFRVETDDFDALAAALPGLVAGLDPLAAQWDRLSPHQCYMLILRGPVKVDLIFLEERHELEPPWRPSPETLRGIDAHFWDWMLWLKAKEASGKADLVAAELEKLQAYLLGPLGIERAPASVAEAVSAYRAARDRAERELGAPVPRELEAAVAPALSR